MGERGTGGRGGGGHKKTRRPLPGHDGDRMCFAKSWEASRRRQDVWSQWLSQFLSIPTDFHPTDPFRKPQSPQAFLHLSTPLNFCDPMVSCDQFFKNYSNFSMYSSQFHCFLNY